MNKKKDFLLKLTLGDWSDDGHGQYEEIYVLSNYDVHAMREAYKESCMKTGLYFHDIAIHPHWRKIWTDYHENNISENALKILEDYGIIDKDEIPETEQYNVDQAAEIIMRFIKLSMPDDFKYKFVEIDATPINGWWNDELNVQFGYGLFL